MAIIRTLIFSSPHAYAGSAGEVSSAEWGTIVGNVNYYKKNKTKKKRPQQLLYYKTRRNSILKNNLEITPIDMRGVSLSVKFIVLFWKEISYCFHSIF